MSILKIKDEKGNWVGVPAIKGEQGEPGEVSEEYRQIYNDVIAKWEQVTQRLLPITEEEFDELQKDSNTFYAVY